MSFIDLTQSDDEIVNIVNQPAPPVGQNRHVIGVDESDNENTPGALAPIGGVHHRIEEPVDRIEFTVVGRPVPQRQRRWWHGIYWNPSRNDMLALVEHINHHRPNAPWEGAVALELTFTLRPPNDPAWRIPALFPVRRPDLDNLCKLVFDALTHARFYNDDAQVVRLVASKVHGDVESTAVVLRRV